MTTYTAVLVTPGSRVLMPLLTRIDGALKQMRLRADEPFLPVAIWPIEPDRFCKVAGLIELPAVKTIEWAAARFGVMPIVQEWQMEFTRHLRHSDTAALSSLFNDWRRAVNAKEVVATREVGLANRLVRHGF